MKNTFTAFLFMLLFGSVTYADTIFFKNGTRLDIQETWEEDGYIKCEIYGIVVSYPKKDIERVEKSPKNKEQNISVLPEGSGKDDYDNLPDQDQSLAGEEDLDRQQSIRYHNEAVKLAHKKAWPEAIKLEKKAYTLNPEEKAFSKTLASMYNSYAVELKNKGKRQKAIENLQYALEYDQHPKIKKNITIIYVDLAREAFNQRDYVQCQKLLTKGAHFNENNPHLYVLSGKIAYNNDKYNVAQKNWEKALKLNPKLSQVRYLLKKLNKETIVEDGFDTKGTGQFNIKFEGTENKELVDDTIEVLQNAYNDVGRDFDLYPREQIQVIIYPKSNLRELDYFPDWASGLYDGKIRFGEDLWKKKLYEKSVLYHEYTHVLVRMLGGPNVALWFNEGLAEYEARRFKWIKKRRSTNTLLRKTKKQKKLIPFSQLENVFLSGLNSVTISLVYAQSESFVTYLIERYSLYEMRSILVRLGKGESFQKVLEDVLCEDFEILEQDWKNQLK
jgi:tetratricopeptide (TPR) repeat protein